MTAIIILLSVSYVFIFIKLYLRGIIEGSNLFQVIVASMIVGGTVFWILYAIAFGYSEVFSDHGIESFTLKVSSFLTMLVSIFVVKVK